MSPNPPESFASRARQRFQTFWDWARQHGRGVGLELLINFVLPFVIYYGTVSRWGDVGALMASSAPPIGWSLWEFLRKRRIDALSVLVLLGIALSLLGFIGGGGARFLQLRERLATAVIGLVFIGSAVIGKPLVYQLARARLHRDSPSDAQAFQDLQNSPAFRRSMTVITVVWGFGMIAESAFCCVLVFTLTIPQYLVVNPIVGYLSMGLLAAWTFWYVRRSGPGSEASDEQSSSVSKVGSTEPRTENLEGQ